MPHRGAQSRGTRSSTSPPRSAADVDLKWMTKDTEWIFTACKSIEPEMTILKKKFDAPNAAIAQLRDELYDILRKAGLLVEDVIMQAKFLGVHPKNRYGDGVTPSDVLGLISDIFTQGFSENSLQDPCFTEQPPQGHPRASLNTQFNKEQMEGSGGQLPQYTEELKGVTTTCGHTN